MNQNITAQDIIFGKSILPAKIIELMSPDEWEEFIKEWLETKQEQYFKIEKYGGSGDMGRDVVAYITDPKENSEFYEWECYQCKHYDNAVKRDLIHSSLKLLISKGLVEINYTDKGIEYLASELTSPFLDNLSEEYTKNLSNKVKWVCEKFKESTYENIKQFVSENKSKWGSEISYCTIGLIDE